MESATNAHISAATTVGQMSGSRRSRTTATGRVLTTVSCRVGRYEWQVSGATIETGRASNRPCAVDRVARKLTLVSAKSEFRCEASGEPLVDRL